MRTHTRGVLPTAPPVLILLVLAVVLVLVVAGTWGAGALHGQSATVQFIFTSDAHYGLRRDVFQGRSNVDAHVVNATMIGKMNTLPGVAFPKDGGLRSGEKVGAFDFVAEGGDIVNRQEMTESGLIQPAVHDVSNAVGFYRPMVPLIDKTSVVEIYNRMMAPSVPKTTSTYSYATNKVLFSHDFSGVHFLFITMWPDSGVREGMARDLARVSSSTPVIVFTHDQPEAEAKHFTNPNGKHDINSVDKFENLLADPLADGTSVDAPTDIEQRAWQSFVAEHPNITAYFHGNSNWNQFYDWTGPDHRVVLHTFRVDSPMKGAISSKKERKLSFQVVTLDTASRTMTVRECLWDIDPQRPSAPVAWGSSTTVALSPRPAAHR